MPTFLARIRPAIGITAGLLLLARPTAAAPASPPSSAAQAAPDDADRLFESRDVTSVEQAADVWKRRLALNARDAESAWKLSRSLYWLGANGPGTRESRRPYLEDGIAVARRAIAVAPASPHGHFWLAANMGLLSELFGRREGLRYREDIKRALERVIAADPAYLHGSAERALGRWYATVPAMFGGDKKAGEAHLRAAVALKGDSPITLVLLGELLLDTGRSDQARAQFTAALTAPPDPEWTPEDQRFKERAREHLANLDSRRR